MYPRSAHAHAETVDAVPVRSQHRANPAGRSGNEYAVAQVSVPMLLLRLESMGKGWVM